MIYFLSLQKENPSFSQGGGHQNLMLWKKHLTLTEKNHKAIALLFMKDSVFEHPALTLVCTVNTQLNHLEHPFLYLEKCIVQVFVIVFSL